MVSGAWATNTGKGVWNVWKELDLTKWHTGFTTWHAFVFYFWPSHPDISTFGTVKTSLSGITGVLVNTAWFLLENLDDTLIGSHLHHNLLPVCCVRLYQSCIVPKTFRLGHFFWYFRSTQLTETLPEQYCLILSSPLKKTNTSTNFFCCCTINCLCEKGKVA